MQYQTHLSPKSCDEAGMANSCLPDNQPGKVKVIEMIGMHYPHNIIEIKINEFNRIKNGKIRTQWGWNCTLSMKNLNLVYKSFIFGQHPGGNHRSVRY